MKIPKNLISIFELLRPSHWVKNFFVLAPLFFSKHMHDVSIIWRISITFTYFCFLSSIIYILNDLVDRDKDKVHPIKRTRPLASGALRLRVAYGILLGLVLLSSFLYPILKWEITAIGLMYVVLNLLYSFCFKNIPVLDVFCIAFGFVLRVIAGGIAVEVPATSWVIVTTFFLALFLGYGKRRGEFLLQQQTNGIVTVAKGYTLELIDHMMILCALLSIISYVLFTFSEHVFLRFGTRNLVFTTVFVVAGIFRYIFLIYSRTTDDDPTRILYLDRFLFLVIISWLLSCVIIIGA